MANFYELKKNGTNFIFTLLSKHIKVLHFYKVQTENLSDVLIIIQELIYVGYQQSK